MSRQLCKLLESSFYITKVSHTEFCFKSAGVQGEFSFIAVDWPIVKKVMHANEYVQLFISLSESSLK